MQRKGILLGLTSEDGIVLRTGEIENGQHQANKPLHAAGEGASIGLIEEKNRLKSKPMPREIRLYLAFRASTVAR